MFAAAKFTTAAIRPLEPSGARRTRPPEQALLLRRRDGNDLARRSRVAARNRSDDLPGRGPPRGSEDRDRGLLGGAR